MGSIAKLYFTNIKVLLQLNPCEGAVNSATCPLPNNPGSNESLADVVDAGGRLFIGRMAPTGGKTLEQVLSNLGITDRLPLISVLNPGALVPTHEATRRRRAAGGNLLISGSVANELQPEGSEFCITTDNIQK